MSSQHERKGESRVDETVAESFPASDPPSSHLPDEPPVNAQAKWDAAKRAEEEGTIPDPNAPSPPELAAKRRIGSDTLFRN